MRSRSFSETSKRVIPLTQNVYGLENLPVYLTNAVYFLPVK